MGLKRRWRCGVFGAGGERRGERGGVGGQLLGEEKPIATRSVRKAEL
jgi:hypothetical protein